MAAAGSSDGLQPIGPGTVVLVVGPSGAGKDSVISGVRAECEGSDSRLVFPARIITRSSHETELHRPASQIDFDAGLANGDFALSWRAHGLSYAISSDIDHDVLAGRTVIINTSRGVVAAARKRYVHVRVVLVDAPYTIRANRLAARGRETRADVERRLSRAVAFEPGNADLVIDNGGDLSGSVAEFCRWLHEQALLTR